MPELPEVERAVRELRRALVGRRIAAARAHHAAMRRRLSPAARAALAGRSIAAVERRGKHQLLWLDDGRLLAVHFRMNGDWVVDRAADPLPRFGRLSLEFTDGTRAVLVDSRALSTAAVLADDRMFDTLGPEPDDRRLTAATLRDSLVTRRIPIKVALLDQRVIAGIGNIYAAESLWRARIDPRAPANSLDLAQVKALLVAIRAVLTRATGARYTDTPGARLAVYDREDTPCRRCRTPVARITQAGRSTYFCPGCQRGGRPSRATPRPGAERP